MSDNPTLDALDGPPADQGELFDATARLVLDLNDAGNARRLEIALGPDAIYVVGRGWGVWDSRRYNFEGGAARMMARGACLQRLHEEETAALKSKPVPADQVAAYMADNSETDRAAAERKLKAARVRKRAEYAKSCGNLSRIRAAVELAVAGFLTDAAALDADRTVLQVQNGTLDLKALAAVPDAEDPAERIERWRAALGEHRRDGLPTRLAACDFDPEAAAPEWRRFIDLVEPDAASQAYLKRCLGMVLGGRAGEIWLMLLGKGGNGKSTIMKALEAVMGDYAQPCRVEMFLEHRNSGAMGPTPEEAVLPGARVYTTHEPKQGATLDAGKIKGMTGGDRRQANPKNQALFNYVPVGVPVLQANKMPNVNDPSEGFWRRVYPVMFGVALHELPEAERRTDAEMLAILAAERSGILNWLIEGYVEFRDIGLRPPPKVQELKGSLRALSDPVGQFLADMTRHGAGLSVRTSELQRAFNAWSESEGHRPLGARAFTATMLALDYVRFQRTHWYWRGLELTASLPLPEDR